MFFLNQHPCACCCHALNPLLVTHVVKHTGWWEQLMVVSRFHHFRHKKRCENKWFGWFYAQRAPLLNSAHARQPW